MLNWTDFLWSADQFIVSYSVDIGLIPVKLFEIGHAVELYLKASYAKQKNNVDQAVFFGHRLKDLWDACKCEDPAFMPSFEIRDTVFNSNFVLDQGRFLNEEDVKNFWENQEFYYVLKHLSDIKYIGSPLKSKSIVDNAGIWGYHSHNPYWINFFKEIRQYLKYPTEHTMDWIKYFIESNEIPDSSKIFLKKLYE
jgi:hypothetical protein